MTRPAPHDHADRVAAFYERHALQLTRRVAHRARVPLQTVEDACQHAWMLLLRRPDVILDERGLTWLAVVATHEAWRATGRELPLDELPDPMLAAATAHMPGVDELVGDREELTALMRALGELKPAERTALYLQGLGYRYREIADITNATYTAVNRRITEGRARARRLARDRQPEPARPS